MGHTKSLFILNEDTRIEEPTEKYDLTLQLLLAFQSI